MKPFKEYKGFENCERVTLICDQCGDEFQRYKGLMRKNPATSKFFCNKRCWYDYRSANKITWNKGLKGVMKPNSGSFKKGEHRSPETEFKVGDKVGPKNNLWKGGITPINTRIRQSSEYKQWRKNVFERDNFTCQMCGDRGVKIHADHILPFAQFVEARFELSNGRTLCVPCHKSTPTYLRKCKQIQ